MFKPSQPVGRRAWHSVASRRHQLHYNRPQHLINPLSHPDHLPFSHPARAPLVIGATVIQHRPRPRQPQSQIEPITKTKIQVPARVFSSFSSPRHSSTFRDRIHRPFLKSSLQPLYRKSFLTAPVYQSSVCDMSVLETTVSLGKNRNIQLTYRPRSCVKKILCEHGCCKH